MIYLISANLLSLITRVNVGYERRKANHRNVFMVSTAQGFYERRIELLNRYMVWTLFIS